MTAIVNNVRNYVDVREAVGDRTNRDNFEIGAVRRHVLSKVDINK